MAEVAELPIIKWITQRFRGRPVPVTETPPQMPLESEPPRVIKTPVAPALSRQERRTRKKAEYLMRKATHKRTEPESPSQPAARLEVSTPPLKSEARSANLPSGIKEKVRFHQGLLITEADMPWLNGDRVQVALEKITLATSKGEQFLYGSLIYGKKLGRLLSQFTPGELKSADNLLFVQLSELMQDGFAPDIEMVHNHVTNKPIFETGNQNGGRVYFMRFGQIQGLPVIMRIAAAKDHKIGEVFSVICRERG